MRSAEVAERIGATLGSRIVFTYHLNKWIPFFCFGDTGHFVTGVKSVADPPPPGAVPGY